MGYSVARGKLIDEKPEAKNLVTVKKIRRDTCHSVGFEVILPSCVCFRALKGYIKKTLINW
jgi:hypothetical protein